MSLFDHPELFDEAQEFLRRLDDLCSEARASRQQFVVPQSGTTNPYPEAVLREDVVFPRLLAGFIFRGQRNAEWGLVPSVFRDGTLLALNDGLPGKADWNHSFWFRQFLIAEFRLAGAFSWMAQEIGLETPHRAGKFEHLLKLLNEQKSGDDLPQHLDRICDLENPLFADIAGDLAVAQHHGVPTRLLDWTEDPYIASYFASYDAASGDDIAVFALSTIDFFYEEVETAFTSALSLVRAPRARELFIQRQKGLFTIARNALTRHVDYGFDLEQYFCAVDSGKKHGSVLKKLVLRKSEVTCSPDCPRL